MHLSDVSKIYSKVASVLKRLNFEISSKANFTSKTETALLNNF